MSRQVIIRAWAVEDLRSGFGYIGQNNIEKALQFLQSAEQTFSDLAEMPGVGKRRQVKNPAMAGLRQWPVNNFPLYLVFYVATEDELIVVRVLHGSRDIDSILEEDDATNDANDAQEDV